MAVIPLHIFLRYCPPTSNNAVVICPSEQQRTASTSTANRFSLWMAACFRAYTKIKSLIVGSSLLAIGGSAIAAKAAPTYKTLIYNYSFFA